MVVLVLRLPRIFPSFAETLMLVQYQNTSIGNSNVPAKNLYLLVAWLPLKNCTRYGSKSQRMMIKFVLTLTNEPKLWRKAVTNNYGCSGCISFDDFVYDAWNYHLLYTKWLFHLLYAIKSYLRNLSSHNRFTNSYNMKLKKKLNVLFVTLLYSTIRYCNVIVELII